MWRWNGSDGNVLCSQARKMSTAPEAKASKNGKEQFQRLPVNAVPVNYEITIKPKFEDFTFQGWETIDMKVITDL